LYTTFGKATRTSPPDPPTYPLRMGHTFRHLLEDRGAPSRKVRFRTVPASILFSESAKGVIQEGLLCRGPSRLCLQPPPVSAACRGLVVFQRAGPGPLDACLQSLLFLWGQRAAFPGCPICLPQTIAGRANNTEICLLWFASAPLQRTSYRGGPHLRPGPPRFPFVARYWSEPCLCCRCRGLRPTLV